MVEFAGYEMPLQYSGIIAEHTACREGAALFDVSHMGQAEIADAAALEAVVTGDIRGLAPGRQRYTLLMNEAGGIVDDLMVANLGDRFQLVLNASRKHDDVAHLRAHGVTVTDKIRPRAAGAAGAAGGFASAGSGGAQIHGGG